MFSVLHLDPNWFATSFVFCLALGGLRRVTGSLVPGMIIHAAWNAMVIGWELGWFPWLW
jgi:membrane protease YdiL (CAAX protease family)